MWNMHNISRHIDLLTKCKTANPLIRAGYYSADDSVCAVGKEWKYFSRL